MAMATSLDSRKLSSAALFDWPRARLLGSKQHLRHEGENKLLRAISVELLEIPGLEWRSKTPEAR